MRNIKDFQARYNRWKKGERYWDIRGVDLPRYDEADKNTNQTSYIYQNEDGSYYAAPTPSSYTEDVTPLIQRNLSDPSTWDFVGSNSGKHYVTQYTDNQLRMIAQNSMPNAEMIPWVDRAGNKHRSMRIIGMSGADPIGSTALDLIATAPLFKPIGAIGNVFAKDFARDFGFTKLGNLAKNKIIANQLNRNINSWDGTISMEYFRSPFKYNSEVLPYKRIELPQKQANGRYQFDSPTYQMYTGPQHDVSEIINTDGSVNLKNLLRIQNEALTNIPGGTIARHRLENAKWHPTDWNTFLHTRDVYKRALENNYPKEALFPTLMHDFGKMWSGDGHGPYGASIVRQIFPKASNEQIKAIYEHMDSNPQQYLSRLVKGADIKEPNKFRTELLLKNLNPKLSENFNANLTSDGIKLFPIKRSDYDLYKTLLYNKLNVDKNQRGIIIIQQKNLGRDVDGDYDPITHLSRISEEAEYPLSVAVHEDISHGSDAFVENQPISKFIPKDLIKRDESVSEYYSDLANITGKSKFREHTDEDWKEMRATLQQLRFASKLPVDNISNSSIESALNHANGYGQDYVSKLSWLNDLQKKRWFDKLRIAWKYLPIATPLIKMKNEK